MQTSYIYSVIKLVAMQLAYSQTAKININNNINEQKMAKPVFRVIRETQVNTPESLLTMPKGRTVTVSCKDFSPYSTVKSAATRLNQRLGSIEFEVSTPDNGATIIIKRNPS